MKNYQKEALKYLKNPTCKYFNGYAPCPVALAHNQKCPSKFCKNIGKRLLIIEMGGMGSVIRATIVAKEYKEYHPDSFITFLTSERCVEVLKLSPYIDRKLSFNLESTLILTEECFEDIFNFEVKQVACALTMKIKANNKRGFGLNKFGKPNLLNDEAYELFLFQVDNTFRAENKKSIQQLLLEAVGFKWKNQIYDIELEKKEQDFAKNLIKRHNPESKKIVMMNIGTRKEHSGKRWEWEKFAKLSINLIKLGYLVVILAGPEEQDLLKNLKREIKDINILFVSTRDSIDKYAAIITYSDVFVSSATLGIILAISFGKKTVMLNTCRPGTEINNYKRGVVLTHDTNRPPCFKTKLGQCLLSKDKQFSCIRDIPVNDVIKAIKITLSM